ncbi:hypothetical protein DXG03_009308 [Asterophora parasitica]|uniref:Uncharacterized protein n=1 Tax=Asterophora parasitica TaxID=117018 RepID=A0A9P7GB25_9AGAR|nr:hypothetical protein DXG03_009308 [Asterophora parasitica]
MRRVSLFGEPLEDNHERFTALTTAFSQAERSRPATPFVVAIGGWIKMLKNPNADPPIDAALVIHAIGYLEYLLFLADAMALAGVWSCNLANTVTGAVNLERLYSQHSQNSTVPSLDALSNALGTTDNHRDLQGQTWMFRWKTLVLDGFHISWYHAGQPGFTLDELLNARREVIENITSLIQDEPELICHCEVRHPNLTGAEYMTRLRRWRHEVKKGQLLRLSGPVPSRTWHRLSTPTHRMSPLSRNLLA